MSHNRKNKPKKKNRITKHHIMPKSRGGKSNLENIVGLKESEHRAYHVIFSNKTPDEIVEHLAEKYWKGQWDYVRQAYEAHLNYVDATKNRKTPQ